MDLQSFRTLVDTSEAEISTFKNNPDALYQYVGLAAGGNFQLSAVAEALDERIRATLTSGDGNAWWQCRSLRTDLIREHVISDAPLAPYYGVLSRLQDALNPTDPKQGHIIGDWAAAVKAAIDHIAINSWEGVDPERIETRNFAVARAARWLKDQGYAIRLATGEISLEASADAAVLEEIERLISIMGGLNVARRLFAAISSLYDVDMQRYHLIPSVSMTGEGKTQVPWGYLLQLSVKHLVGQKPYANTDQNWDQLIHLITAYAAVFDVQPYVPMVFGGLDPQGLIQTMREIALYDTVFRFPQLRPADVVRLCEGLLGFLDHGQPTPNGWSLGQALEIIAALFSRTPDVRGPVVIRETDVRRSLPHVPKDVINYVLEHVLSHPVAGANQNYSRPTDAPPDRGIDFLFRPLLHLSGRRFLMIDRSVGAAACPEALLTAFRSHDRGLDDKVGKQAERFLEAEFAAHGVTVNAGDYDVGKTHGECDLVTETTDRVVFWELKKKPLTRKARAGADVELLLDISGSLLAAQAQSGWHELHLRQAGSLTLVRDNKTYQLDRNSREIERVAVALLDYGSFQ